MFNTVTSTACISIIISGIISFYISCIITVIVILILSPKIEWDHPKDHKKTIVILKGD